MSIAYTERAETRSRTAVAPAWLFVGAGIYLLLLIRGDGLLRDADTFWQIKVGQWIAAHHAVPFTDIYSFTRAGEPWISTSWLAQVLFAQAFDVGGWAGVVVLTALAAAAALALLAHVLCRFLPPLQVGVVICAVFALASPHLLARPHVLAMPVMIAWAERTGLGQRARQGAVAMAVAADDCVGQPSWWLRVRSGADRRLCARCLVECGG
jgi:hypothetical protein